MELRWVLALLGLLVIVGVYLWGRGIFRQSSASSDLRRRPEPRLDGAGAESSTGEEGAPPLRDKRARQGATVIERKPSPRRLPEKVVALRLVQRGEHPSGERTVLALRKCGLEHGLYGVFHRVVDGDVHNPLFSVARLTEPGSFDLTKLAETEIPGLSLFLALPGNGDPVERFDAMLDTARSLARELDADLLDEKGSSWSVQRERYLREEMIQYRHHLEHG
jgi:cell division protein ZipA